MTPLPDYFRSDHFDFRLLARNGDVALIEKSKRGGTSSFEVGIIQRRPAEMICGQLYPAREAMPRSEEWGTAGFSYCDRDQAEARFAKLVKERKTGRITSKSLRSSPDHQVVGAAGAM